MGNLHNFPGRDTALSQLASSWEGMRLCTQTDRQTDRQTHSSPLYIPLSPLQQKKKKKPEISSSCVVLRWCHKEVGQMFLGRLSRDTTSSSFSWHPLLTYIWYYYVHYYCNICMHCVTHKTGTLAAKSWAIVVANVMNGEWRNAFIYSSTIYEL